MLRTRKIRRAVHMIAVIAAGFATGLTCASAEDFNAGKTPAQLFVSNCSACHRSPRDLAINDKTLLAFLSVHYTTSAEDAETMTRYLLSAGGTPEPGPAGRRATTERRRNREAPAIAPSAVAVPADETSQETPARRKRKPAKASREAPQKRAAAKSSGSKSGSTKSEAGTSETATPDVAKPESAKPAAARPADAKPSEPQSE